MNLYAYVGNDPGNVVDPWGLDASDIIPGILTALSEGAKGGLYASKQAIHDIKCLDRCGDPIVKAGLNLSKVTLSAPFAYAGITRLFWYYKVGYEWKWSKGRIAPFGNRTPHSIGKWPHYHRVKLDPLKPGEGLPGQGIGRHRPWVTKSPDTSFWDRF